MIEIAKLIKYIETDMIFVTNHAAERLRERKIKMRDIKVGILNGIIIEQYPEDYPFPSCLILGQTTDKRPVHIVMSDEGTASRIITAYIPSTDKWELNYSTRKGE
ncbi:MAG: DUF4258 domain-containing protein [Eubacteriales bacterium]